jgi:hypothetical protein
LLSNSEKIIWSNKFSMYLFVEIIYFEIKMTFASYETLGFES